MEKKSILAKVVKMYCVLPINLFGIYAIYILFIEQPLTYWWIYTFIGYICLMMLGIAGCYHRLLSHKSYTVSKYIKIILLWFAALAGQGSPVFWVAIHRGYHHRYADTANDAHSPHNGFWHSYILWMFNFDYKNLNIKTIPDIIRDKECIFFHRYYGIIFFTSHLIIAMIDAQLWLYLLALPAFLTLHANCINTSLNHCQSIGYKNFHLADSSVNSIWLFPFIQGEAWHNNHHHNPKSLNYGQKWWEFDPTFYLLCLIKKF